MSLLLACRRGKHNLNKYNAKQKISAMIEAQSDTIERFRKIGVIRKVFGEE